MIKYQKNPNNNIVEIYVDGKITPKDFQGIVHQLKADIEQYGELRLLEEIHHFEGIDPVTLLKDILFGLSPGNDFTHAAVVSNAQWIPTYTEAIDSILLTKVKAFESSQINQARVWLANS